ncbi:hypothetical protein [Cytobacillus sp. Bac17]|nr:hypothetical protein [Cytobacillus sp. Bac17]
MSKEVMSHVSDGDWHTKLENIKYSTSLREIVTVQFMLDNPID